LNPPNAILPNVYLARHGETAWSLTGQHTGLTDLPLTKHGERNARHLGKRLRGLTFVKVFTSPLQRAARTCELAGFKAAAEIDQDLVEWNYGAYEGRRTIEIRADRPDWQLFRDGCPGGESPEQVGARADRVISRVRAIAGADRALAWTGTRRRPIFCAGYRQLERAWLRTQPVRPGDPVVERYAPCRRVILPLIYTLHRPTKWGVHPIRFFAFKS